MLLKLNVNLYLNLYLKILKGCWLEDAKVCVSFAPHCTSSALLAKKKTEESLLEDRNDAAN